MIFLFDYYDYYYYSDYDDILSLLLLSRLWDRMMRSHMKAYGIYGIHMMI